MTIFRAAPPKCLRAGHSRYPHIMLQRSFGSCDPVSTYILSNSLFVLSYKTSVSFSYLLFIDDNVKPLLQLAIDYDVKILRKHCDQYVVDKLKACERNEDRVECLMMADQFKLPVALKRAVSQLSRLSVGALTTLDSTLDIGPVMMCQILQRQMESMETCGNEAGNPTLPVSNLMDVNLSPPGQNGRHFGRRYFELHFLRNL